MAGFTGEEVWIDTGKRNDDVWEGFTWHYLKDNPDVGVWKQA
jgi:hypothetical protein